MAEWMNEAVPSGEGSVTSSCCLHPCGLSPLSFWHCQDEQLRTLVRQFGQQDWKFLASHFPVSEAPSPRDRVLGDQTMCLGQTCCQGEKEAPSQALSSQTGIQGPLRPPDESTSTQQPQQPLDSDAGDM